MNNLLKIHAELIDEDLNQLWEKGLFVFDANVLLDLYRFPENAKEDLLNILSDKKINKRIWLPFQAVLEFTNNRLEAVSDQKNKFAQVKSILCKTIEKINSSYDELKSEIDKLQLKKRHSVINPDSYLNEELFREPLSKLNEFISHLDELEKRQPDVNDKDLLQKKILKIFNNKIGASFSKEDLGKIYKEGEERYKEQIPPGYKDDDKKGFYLFEDKKFIRKYGDLVVWKEIINKANEESLEFIVLVTGDVKEDWWQEKRGKKLGARYELLNEIYFEASSVKLFHIYDTSNFMKYAKKYLDIDIKDESINEAKDLLNIRTLLDQISLVKTSLAQISKRVGDDDKPSSATDSRLFKPNLEIEFDAFPMEGESVADLHANVYAFLSDWTQTAERVDVNNRGEYLYIYILFSQFVPKRYVSSFEEALNLTFGARIVNWVTHEKS